ncbi:hypothetical protein M8C21_026336, partial [Ambrosia artemisiifolia]
DSNFSPDFFDSSAEYFGDQTKFFSAGIGSSDDIFGILEALEGVSDEFTTFTPLDEMKHGVKDGGLHDDKLVSQKSSSSSGVQEPVEAVSQGTKRKKVEEGCESLDGSSKMNHVTVERNRRKTMNEHLAILRSLMPCFYVKRGDQASIIGGVIDYITELQQVLQSLEAKKKRKVYSDVLSPRLISSPRTLPLSPRKPPLSPRPSLPISPRRKPKLKSELLQTTTFGRV